MMIGWNVKQIRVCLSGLDLNEHVVHGWVHMKSVSVQVRCVWVVQHVVTCAHGCGLAIGRQVVDDGDVELVTGVEAEGRTRCAALALIAISSRLERELGRIERECLNCQCCVEPTSAALDHRRLGQSISCEKRVVSACSGDADSPCARCALRASHGISGRILDLRKQHEQDASAHQHKFCFDH